MAHYHYPLNRILLRPIINLFIFFSSLLLSLVANGQSIYNQEIQSYLSNIKEEKVLHPQLDFVISDIVDDRHNGLVHVYIQHTLEGLPIIGSISGFHFNFDTNLEYTALRIPEPDVAVQKKTPDRPPARQSSGRGFLAGLLD